MKIIIIIISTLILITLGINAYTPQSYDDVNITLGTVYTPQNYQSVNLTLGDPTTVAADTCTCPEINTNWEIDMSDLCTISDNCDLGTGTLSFTGTGTTTCDAIINTTNLGDPGANGKLLINDNCTIDISKAITAIMCYQESANVSTACGGLSTGTYEFSGVWTSPENTTDGDYTTFGFTTFDGSENLSINYSKPSGSLLSSLWQNQLGTGAIQNISIPIACWNQDILSFRVNSDYTGIQATWKTLAFCFNGTAWDEIISDDASSDAEDIRVYEESMWWNITI